MKNYIPPDEEFVGSMPHYLFQVGEEFLELAFESRNEAPDFGEEVRLPDGRVARRILQARHRPTRVPEARCIDVYFASKSLPLWYEHHTGPFNEKGEPCFSSRREVNETVARAQHGGDYLRYDHPS